jgi:catechol 2,3-dioxygenase-like lactoylglutathione lyase family enzyme
MHEQVVTALDHVVLTVADVDAAAEWYARVLGLTPVRFDGDRVALHFGAQKLNLHPAHAPYEPHASVAIPGTADLCFVTTRDLDEVVAGLEREQVEIELGPVERSGARGAMDSVYVRDLDANLIEIARYR